MELQLLRLCPQSSKVGLFFWLVGSGPCPGLGLFWSTEGNQNCAGTRGFPSAESTLWFHPRTWISSCGWRGKALLEPPEGPLRWLLRVSQDPTTLSFQTHRVLSPQRCSGILWDALVTGSVENWSWHCWGLPPLGVGWMGCSVELRLPLDPWERPRTGLGAPWDRRRCP